MASSADTSARNHLIRDKATTPDSTLPPISELVETLPTTQRYVDLDGALQDVDYGSIVGQDMMPIPMPVDREGYGDIENSHRYWAGGYTDWLNVREAIQRHVVPALNDRLRLRLLDFGCASGRFLRHTHTFAPELVDSWGCDYAPANIAWMKRHLATEIKAVVNTDVPHLPFSDGYFDVITAFSVFTHIDVLEDAWLLELRRITRPGGLLYLTIHNDATWEKLKDRPSAVRHLEKAIDPPKSIVPSDELIHGPLPLDRFALRMSTADIYNCNVWMSSEYIHANWSRYFDILGIADNAHLQYQSPVLLTPR